MSLKYITGLRVGKPTKAQALKDALRAIEFALKIDDHYDMREFLRSWSEGDVAEWPEFVAGEDPEP